MAKKLVIVGDSSFAEIAYEYFTYDSNFVVAGFAVERSHRTRETLFDLPVVDLESVEKIFPPEEHMAFVALTYKMLNRIRGRLFFTMKDKGYSLATYVSSRAFVWRNVKLGENAFIFEGNVIQPFSSIEDNVILWSGNHIGHHSVVRKNCFISSHVVISGYCEIGENSFLGVNSTIANNIILGKDSWIGPGVTISKNTKSREVYATTALKPSNATSFRLFGIKE